MSELSRLVRLSGGDFPARVSELSSKNWIGVGRSIEFRRVFQQEAVLASLSSADRQSIHKRVLAFEQRSLLEKAHHQLSSGDIEGATKSLSPLVENTEKPVPFEEASRWIPVLSSLIHMLPEKRQRPWLEVLGQMEDRCGHGALRDHAWRQAVAGTSPGSSEALRLTRWRASVQRRDGETRKALSCIEEVSKQAIDFSCPQVVKEATLAGAISKVKYELTTQFGGATGLTLETTTDDGTTVNLCMATGPRTRKKLVDEPVVRWQTPQRRRANDNRFITTKIGSVSSPSRTKDCEENTVFEK